MMKVLNSPKLVSHSLTYIGGAVAEWSKALLVRENKESPKDPGFAPGLGNLKKV